MVNVICVQHTETLICITMLQIKSKCHLPVILNISMMQICTVSFSHSKYGRLLAGWMSL